jgi:hypothetical protein
VDPRDRQRLAIAHRILDAVRNKNFRSETLATGAGNHVIVPAVPDDTMASLFDQVRLTGGPCTSPRCTACSRSLRHGAVQAR